MSNRIIPVALISALGLAAVINSARGKHDQIFTGIVTMDYSGYKFYSDQKDCHPKGTAYWLVPNGTFHDVLPMPRTSDLTHTDMDKLSPGVWRYGGSSFVATYRPYGADSMTVIGGNLTSYPRLMPRNWIAAIKAEAIADSWGENAVF